MRLPEIGLRFSGAAHISWPRPVRLLDLHSPGPDLLDDLVGEPGYTQVVLSNEGLDSRAVGRLSSRPRLVDLNGDGRSEILMIRLGGSKRPAVVRVTHLGPD